jgi:hypothetical protein
MTTALGAGERFRPFPSLAGLKTASWKGLMTFSHGRRLDRLEEIHPREEVLGRGHQPLDLGLHRVRTQDAGCGRTLLSSPLTGTELVDFETFIGWRATPKQLCFVRVSRR